MTTHIPDTIDEIALIGCPDATAIRNEAAVMIELAAQQISDRLDDLMASALEIRTLWLQIGMHIDRLEATDDTDFYLAGSALAEIMLSEAVMPVAHQAAAMAALIQDAPVLS